MRYLLLVYNCDRPEPTDERYEETMARVNAFADECRARGALVAGAPLHLEGAATTVRAGAGGPLVTDGPFVETHEHLGGYYLLDCRDLDEALELAGRWPMTERGAIEVRPVASMSGLDARPREVTGTATDTAVAAGG